MNQNEQQTAHPATVAQEFMKRADMKGGEVEAYAQTFNWLAQFLSGDIVATPKEAHTALIEELTELREFRTKHDEEYAKAEAEKIPVLEPEEGNGENMVSEGGPASELDPVDSETSE